MKGLKIIRINCKKSEWGCVYHACMSNHCQKQIVIQQGIDWGKGECEKQKNK